MSVVETRTAEIASVTKSLIRPKQTGPPPVQYNGKGCTVRQRKVRILGDHLVDTSDYAKEMMNHSLNRNRGFITRETEPECLSVIGHLYFVGFCQKCKALCGRF